MQTAIPQEFKDYAEKLLGEERYGRFEQALYDSPSVSVRMNTNKVRKIFTPSECPEYDTVVPWATAGFYLKSRPSFTSDPLFHAGGYYVQEASSMFLECALRQYIQLSQVIRYWMCVQLQVVNQRMPVPCCRMVVCWSAMNLSGQGHKCWLRI